MPQLSAAEKLVIRSRAATLLVALQWFELYWLPRERRVSGRSVHPRRCYPVPVGAIFVGTYSHGGVRSRDIVADLAELLARLPELSNDAPPAREAGRSGAKAQPAAPCPGPRAFDRL